MRLSSLNLVSNMRVIQPNLPDESQNTDFEIALDRNATISEDFYELVFYKMLNGYLTGEDAVGVNCGFKFVVIDKDNNVLFETSVEKLDKFLTETKKVFEVKTEYNLPDATIDVWVSKVNLQFIANNSNTEETWNVYESTAPQKSSFSEQIDANEPDKGIKIVGGSDSKIKFDFRMEL